MDPPVKRSGWQPPQDTGLWKAADRVAREVWGVLRPGQRDRLKARRFQQADAANVRAWEGHCQRLAPCHDAVERGPASRGA